MGFSRQEYWSVLPCPPPGDFPDPTIELASYLCLLQWQAGYLPLAPPGKLRSIPESESHSVMSSSLQPHGLCSPWNSPGQNTEVSSLSLLQGVFPTQGSNPGLPHRGRILYQLGHQGSPRILEWVAYPFFSGSSPCRNQTRVSWIAGEFFTNWAIREVLGNSRYFLMLS